MYENILNNTPNFCIGPQSGTFCTVDYTTTPPLMHVKNTIGTIIRSYTFSPSGTLSSYPYSIGECEFVAITYVGPKNQTSYYDGAVFYTLERSGDSEVDLDGDVVVNYNKNVIRKWAIDSTNFNLVLKLSYYKESSENVFYNGRSFSVRHFSYSLDQSLSVGSDVIALPSTNDLSKYDLVLIGPSKDSTNVGATEEAYIYSIDEDEVTLRTYSGETPTKYEYLIGDPITVFKDILLFSDPPMSVNEDGEVFGYIEPYGYLHSLSTSNYGQTVHTELNGIFSDITASTWNSYFDCLTFNKGNNLIHLDIRDYKPFKSQVIKNTKPDRTTRLPVYALAIIDSDVYKLQKGATYVSSEKDTYQDWDTYNYVLDSLAPYTSAVTHYLSDSVLGYQGVADITVVVRDQFGVGLINKNVFITANDNSQVVFAPYQNIVTDADGRCVIQCTSDGIFEGIAHIEIKVDGASTGNGSSYIYEYISIPIYVEFYFYFDMFCKNPLYERYMHVSSAVGGFCQSVCIPCQVRRSAPGGDWQWNGSLVETETFLYSSEYVSTSYYSYAAGRYSRTFTAVVIPNIKQSEAVLVFDVKVNDVSFLGTSGQVEIGSNTSGDNYELYANVSYFRNQVTTEYVTVEIPLSDMIPQGSSSINLSSIVRFRLYWYSSVNTYSSLILSYKNVKIRQPVEIEALNYVSNHGKSNLIMAVYQPIFSQISTDKLGVLNNIETGAEFPNTLIAQKNSMMGDYSTPITSYLTTDDYVRVSQNYISRHIDYGNAVTSVLEQYVFVQEATPMFWSDKNMPYVNYWIRLRPFAYSLNPDTLIIKVYEDSYLGITDPLDITALGAVKLYDAGSGLVGIDFSYNFIDYFHHGAVIYVTVTVYDEASTPNLLSINYWFKIIADYDIPYLDCRYPSINDFDVPIDTSILFNVNDLGEGIDIDTLEVYINNRIVTVSCTEYTPGNYHIIYVPEEWFNYGEKIYVFVKVSDKSENKNTLHEGWEFYCISSSGPWFDSDAVMPGKCVEGVSRTNKEVSMQVYAVNGTGINYDSIKLEIGGKYRNMVITPIIYRLQ